MPRKRTKKAGPIRWREWSQEEKGQLRKKYSGISNAILSKEFGRTEKSITGQASALGLRKGHQYRSATSRNTALNNPLTVEDRAKIGRLGGKKGGPARAKSLSPQKRKSIAQMAIASRWKRKKKAPKN